MPRVPALGFPPWSGFGATATSAEENHGFEARSTAGRSCIAVRLDRRAAVGISSGSASQVSPATSTVSTGFAWNPLFDGPGFSSKYDLAVLVLAAPPVAGTTPARLPTAGLLDTLATG